MVLKMVYDNALVFFSSKHLFNKFLVFVINCKIVSVLRNLFYL